MLIFTHLCRIVAVLGLLLGIFMVWNGYLTATTEYVGHLDSTGAYNEPLTEPQKQHIQWWSEAQFKNGFITLLGSIALGMLAEISFSLRKK